MDFKAAQFNHFRKKVWQLIKILTGATPQQTQNTEKGEQFGVQPGLAKLFGFEFYTFPISSH